MQFACMPNCTSESQNTWKMYFDEENPWNTHIYLFTSHFDHTPSCTICIYIRIIYVCARNFVTGFSFCCAHCQRQTDRCVLCASVKHCTSFIHVGRIGFISTKMYAIQWFYRYFKVNITLKSIMIKKLVRKGWY